MSSCRGGFDLRLALHANMSLAVQENTSLTVRANTRSSRLEELPYGQAAGTADAARS